MNAKRSAKKQPIIMDDVLRRMLSTSPDPHVQKAIKPKPNTKQSKKKPA